MKCHINIEKTIIDMCGSIEKDNKSMGKFISSEIEKITLLRELISEDTLITSELTGGLNEINKLISSLTMHEWLLIKKIEAVNDLMNHLEA